MPTLSAPLPQEWIDKFKGKFDAGWDAYREETLARQKRLGIVPANTDLTVRPDDIPAWNTLQPEQKRLYARMMEVFVAYGAHADAEMGRIVDAVKALPNADNTMIIYILGDNGASAEGGLEGTLKATTWQTVCIRQTGDETGKIVESETQVARGRQPYERLPALA